MPPRRPMKTDPLKREIEAAFQPGHFIEYRAGWSFLEGLGHAADKVTKAMHATGGADLHSLIEFWLETKEMDRARWSISPGN